MLGKFYWLNVRIFVLRGKHKERRQIFKHTMDGNYRVFFDTLQSCEGPPCNKPGNFCESIVMVLESAYSHAITVLVLVAIVLVSSSLELDKKIVVDRRKFIMLMP
jgi:hypothetical protein